MSIFKWLWNICIGSLIIFLLISLYCYIFNISLTYFIVYYITPFISLGFIIYNIIVKVIQFPYYITIEIWNILIRILSVFTFILSIINETSLFFINLTTAI
jgi:hypothetical protein